MTFKRRIALFSVCALAATCFSISAAAQGRDRVVVKQTSSQPTNLPPASQPVAKVQTTGSSRPILTNDPEVKKAADAAWEPLVEKTASTKAMATVPAMAAAGRTVYNATTSVKLDNAIKARYGLPYHYGSMGPNSYDCSGFVWAAFQDADIKFTRTSAASLWAQSEPVEGADRFKFGTLVFFNSLGHIGIVADENGFYQASSSRGITYSPFKGYWENRIVGFRRLKSDKQAVPATAAAASAPAR